MSPVLKQLTTDDLGMLINIVFGIAMVENSNHPFVMNMIVKAKDEMLSKETLAKIQAAIQKG